MTIPSTTPGARARAPVTNARAPSEHLLVRRVATGLLLAALPAILVVALSGAIATQRALADQRSASTASTDPCAVKRPIFVTAPGRWRCQNLYMARVALDARKHPGGRRAKTNFLHAGEWVSIRCQDYHFDKNTGAQLGLYDKVGDYFVPDKYMRTRFTGRIPGAPVCLTV